MSKTRRIRISYAYTAYYSRRTGRRIAKDNLYRYQKIRRKHVVVSYVRSVPVPVRRIRAERPSGQPEQFTRGVRGQTTAPVRIVRRKKPRRATRREIQIIEQREEEIEEQREALAELFAEQREAAKPKPQRWTDARGPTIDDLRGATRHQLGQELWDQEMQDYLGLGYPELTHRYNGPADKKKPRGDTMPFYKDRAWTEEEMDTRSGNQFYVWAIFRTNDDVTRYVVNGRYRYTSVHQPPEQPEGRRLRPSGYALVGFPWRYEPSKASAKQSLTPREAYGMLTDRTVEEQADGSPVTMPLWEVALRRYIERTSGAKVRGVKLLGFTGGL